MMLKKLILATSLLFSAGTVFAATEITVYTAIESE